MKSQYSRWLCTISAMAVALGACAPVPASVHVPGAALFMGIPLPPGPLGQLSQAALNSLAQQVTWEGCTTVARTSAATAPAPAPPPTNIQICAASYSRLLGPGNTAVTGVLTARMVNVGAYKDARWGLTPGQTSYIVSFPRATSQGEYAILEVSATPAPGAKVKVVKANGIYRYCPHGGTPSVSEASFYTCEQRAQMHRRSRSSDAGSGPNGGDDDVLVQNLDGPAWITCSAGCCTTEAT